VLETDKFVIETEEANAIEFGWWPRSSVPFDGGVLKNALEIVALRLELAFGDFPL
jgi:hypothetical protein